MVNLWPVKSSDEIRSNWDQDQIQSRSNLRSNLAVDCHNLLTLLKRVRGSKEIFQLYGKNQNRSRGSTDLPFLASQKLILASQQGYFSDLNRFSICFYIFKRQYTLAFLMNSPPGAQRERTAHTKTPQAETSSRRTMRSWIQRLYRESLLYSGYWYPNTFFSRNFQNQARRNS